MLPDGDNLSRAEVNVVHLSNKDGGDGFVERSSVHVDGGANRKNEASDTPVNTQVLLQTAERDWQSGSAENNSNGMLLQFSNLVSTDLNLFKPGCSSKTSDPGLEDAMEELEGVASGDDEEGEGEGDAGVEQQTHDHGQHVHSQRHRRVSQILDAHNLPRDETHQPDRRVPVTKRDVTGKQSTLITAAGFKTNLRHIPRYVLTITKIVFLKLLVRFY